jgi:hypothetical protein
MRLVGDRKSANLKIAELHITAESVPAMESALVGV